MARLGFDDRFAGRLAEWRQELTIWERDQGSHRVGREGCFQEATANANVEDMWAYTASQVQALLARRQAAYNMAEAAERIEARGR